MNKKIDFLGQGWAFPPDFSLRDKGVKMVREEEDIQQSLQILFSTSLGERVMQYDYGCDLHAMVFEKLDTNTMTLLKDTLETAIIYHEPRIKLISIEAENALKNGGFIEFMIEYYIRTTNTRTNFVFPFYLNESTQNFYKKV